jgi:hypothetical protein
MRGIIQNESLDHLRKKVLNCCLIGSTSPIKSATVTSGIIFQKNVRFYATMILSIIAFGLNISLAKREMGCKGSSFISEPVTNGMYLIQQLIILRPIWFWPDHEA